MVSLRKLITTLAFIGRITAKQHFISDDPVVESEHAMVRASKKTCELCFFDDTEDKINDSNNKFCMAMSGDLRVGFEWTQNFQPFSKEQQTGKIEVFLKFYSK